jgi:hypothetical protein
VSARWGNDVTTAGAEIDAGEVSVNTGETRHVVAEVAITGVVDEVHSSAAGQAGECSWKPRKLVERLERTWQIYVDDADGAGDDADVGRRPPPPPRGYEIPVTGRVVEAAAYERMLARARAIGAATGASAVDDPVEREHRPASPGVVESGSERQRHSSYSCP